MWGHSVAADAKENSVQVAAIVIASIMACAALSAASSVFAPLALALLIIALIWPLQQSLQSVLPKLLALAATIVVLAVVVTAFGSLFVWSFSRVGQAIANDAAGFQAAYEMLTVWLEGHGIAIAGFWAEHINIGWYIRLIQTVIARLNSTTSFWLVVLVYVSLGLLEVDDFARNIKRLRNADVSQAIINGSIATAKKMRAYYIVRTQMSLLTGLLVFGVTYSVGLPLAKEWGVLAFALNYIPFLGPLIATLFATVYAIAEFQSWETALLIFILLNVTQVAIGSYVEPRVSGTALSMSPTLVLFSVFFWAYLWGVFGAFIGVPITIAILTFCEQGPSTRWLADVFAGGATSRSDENGQAATVRE
ncbi:MAG: AI-2E family transporter [Hyphomicrobium sp.]|nr:AI-2E family transporter [Hyphomicrobium sp.]